MGDLEYEPKFGNRLGFRADALIDQLILIGICFYKEFLSVRRSCRV